MFSQLQGRLEVPQVHAQMYLHVAITWNLSERRAWSAIPSGINLHSAQ